MAKVGDTYRRIIADENCLVQIKQIKGRLVLGEVIDEPLTHGDTVISSNHAGQQFTDRLTEVEERIAGQNSWDRAIQYQNQADTDFWGSLKGGEVLHYRNHSDQFYRGIAERDQDGEMGLKPTALVGRWSEHERPTRDAYGEIRERYAARQVRERTIFRPNPSFIFEYSRYSGERFIDPYAMEEMDLSVPPLTQHDKEQIALECFLREVREASQGSGHPQERLDRVKALLET